MSERIFEQDRWGNPICGQDFMAGTICTRAPGHTGFHAPECQQCGGDWYDETCTCENGHVTCAECGSKFDPNDDEAGWGNLCWGCCCEEIVETTYWNGERQLVQCYGVISHDGPHVTNQPPLPATDEEIAAAVESIQKDMPAFAGVMKTCVDCGASVLSTMGGDPPTCKTHN